MSIIKKVIELCSNLSIHETRCVSDKYSEIVFLNKEKDKWDKKISEIFGSPVKPAGTKPTKGDSKLAKKYGGIYANQTLFKKEVDDGIIIAMYWPWQDNAHTTLKIAQLEK